MEVEGVGVGEEGAVEAVVVGCFVPGEVGGEEVEEDDAKSPGVVRRVGVAGRFAGLAVLSDTL